MFCGGGGGGVSFFFLCFFFFCGVGGGGGGVGYNCFFLVGFFFCIHALSFPPNKPYIQGFFLIKKFALYKQIRFEYWLLLVYIMKKIQGEKGGGG